MHERTDAAAWPRDATLLLLTIFAAGCAEACPDGYRSEFDQCVTAEAPAHRCSVLPTTKADPRGAGLLVRVDILGGDCLWMDQTETTVEAYQQWVDEVTADSVTWEPTWCAWKTERSDPVDNIDDPCTASIPTLDAQPFAARKPIRCVDFCDAEAFCRHADKRLCYGGETRGVQGPRGVPRDWTLACTNGFETVYPWGNEAEDGECNVSALEDCVNCSPLLVGWEQQCRNANGIADLLGNVAEWTFSCDFIQPGQELIPSGCMIRGGSFNQPLQACSIEAVIPNDSRRRDLGFRCCADLTAEEALLIAE